MAKFQPGQSGNPGGRPRKPPQLAGLAKKSLTELKKLAADPETPVKVKADIWRFFYEAEYGKPSQAIDVTEIPAPVIISGGDSLED